LLAPLDFKVCLELSTNIGIALYELIRLQRNGQSCGLALRRGKGVARTGTSLTETPPIFSVCEDSCGGRWAIGDGVGCRASGLQRRCSVDVEIRGPRLAIGLSSVRHRSGRAKALSMSDMAPQPHAYMGNGKLHHSQTNI
jgi:hypothetical protein